MAKFIRFAEDRRKWAERNAYSIRTEKHNAFLGSITWDSGRKQFVAEFADSCIWCEACLDDVSAFLKELNAAERAKQRGKEKEKQDA